MSSRHAVRNTVSEPLNWDSETLLQGRTSSDFCSVFSSGGETIMPWIWDRKHKHLIITWTYLKFQNLQCLPTNHSSWPILEQRTFMGSFRTTSLNSFPLLFVHLYLSMASVKDRLLNFLGLLIKKGHVLQSRKKQFGFGVV